jgi:hypothetical protein
VRKKVTFRAWMKSGIWRRCRPFRSLTMMRIRKMRNGVIIMRGIRNMGTISRRLSIRVRKDIIG